MLGSLLFINHTCDLFILKDHLKFGSYANDTTPFVYWENFNQILDEFEKHMTNISEWFLHNCLTANAKKFHLFLSTFAEKAVNIENFNTKLSHAEVLLGVTIDAKLSFSVHV